MTRLARLASSWEGGGPNGIDALGDGSLVVTAALDGTGAFALEGGATAMTTSDGGIDGFVLRLCPEPLRASC